MIRFILLTVFIIFCRDSTPWIFTDPTSTRSLICELRPTAHSRPTKNHVPSKTFRPQRRNHTNILARPPKGQGYTTTRFNQPTARSQRPQFDPEGQPPSKQPTSDNRRDFYQRTSGDKSTLPVGKAFQKLVNQPGDR